MAMLDRYKKKGGFSQLLQLIETSPRSKQDQFLKLIADESPAWESAVRQRILTIEKIFSWGPEALSEILSRLHPLQLAVALHGMPPDTQEQILNVLPPISRRKISDLVSEANPTAGEQVTCYYKIVTDVRGFMAQGLVKVEKVDPRLLVPDDIEEKLAATLTGISAADVESFTQTSADGVPTSNNQSSSENQASQQEVDFLKRKMNQLLGELNALKLENSTLKDKLAQIKRIA